MTKRDNNKEGQRQKDKRTLTRRGSPRRYEKRTDSNKAKEQSNKTREALLLSTIFCV